LIKKVLLLLFITISIFASSVNIDNKKVKQEDVQVGVYEKLGDIADIDSMFVTQTGENKTIKELMDGRSTIVSLNYYKCPGICTTQFAAVASLVDRLDVPLDQYQVLTLSIEPKDTPKDALDKVLVPFPTTLLPVLVTLVECISVILPIKDVPLNTAIDPSTHPVSGFIPFS